MQLWAGEKRTQQDIGLVSVDFGRLMDRNQAIIGYPESEPCGKVIFHGTNTHCTGIVRPSVFENRKLPKELALSIVSKVLRTPWSRLDGCRMCVCLIFLQRTPARRHSVFLLVRRGRSETGQSVEIGKRITHAGWWPTLYSNYFESSYLVSPGQLTVTQKNNNNKKVPRHYTISPFTLNHDELS